MISVINGALNVTSAIGGAAQLFGFGDFLQSNKPLKLKAGDKVLNCRIVEIGENQAWEIPNLPTDDGEFRNDTIFRQPQAINLKVFVENAYIDDFINSIEETQNGLNTFSIESLNTQLYENLKCLGYSRETSSQMLGASHFYLSLQEVIFVKALAQSYKNTKNAGYGSKKNQGSTNPQNGGADTAKKSAILDIFS